MVPFDDKANSEFSFFEYSETGGNNDSIRKRMKKILSEAIKNELTKRQKECIMQYYYEHKSVREIAENTTHKQSPKSHQKMFMLFMSKNFISE